MLNLLRAKHSRLLVWTLLVLIVVGLAGFGIGSSGALVSTSVASVGDRQISASDYSRALDQELKSISSQIGRDLPMAEAKQYGIDRQVLGRVVNDAALDNEAARLGLSIGDAAVKAQVMAVPAFKGKDGKFDREAYSYALEHTGLTPSGFEQLLRRDATRELVASGIQSAATLPDSASATVLAYLGERRSFDWMRLDATLLPEPVPAPTDAELEDSYKAHPERYTRPETRKITYASLTPEAVAATIDVPEPTLRAAYDAEPEKYNKPARRILDRIGFASDAEAAAAKARLDSGAVTFDALAVERGLKPADMDQGEVAAASLSPEASAAVFGAAGPGVVGPVPTPLGPSLYRINAILPPSTIPFDTAKADLAKAKAMSLAGEKIAGDTPKIEDLLAGGATLEEIAAETDMKLGTVELSSGTTGGLADDKAFRELAAKAEVGEATDLAQLAGGGIVSLRVDAVEPPALIPLAEVHDRVAADWTRDETERRLAEQAKGYADEIRGGLTLDALAQRLGRPKQSAGPLTRGDALNGAPPALVTDVFAADPGGTVVEPDVDSVILAQVTNIEPFDPAAAQNAAVVKNLRDQFRAQAADDVLALYTAALRDAAGVRVNQNLLDSTVSRFP